MAETSIQWTNATWNPIRGCTKVSPGCKNCYAMGIAARFSGAGLPYEGLGKMTSGGPQWTGKVRTVPPRLDDPLRWQKSRRIFVNSMSDLFHEALPVETIADVFAVMYLAPQHTFQVLTKRAHRMREVLTAPWFYPLVLARAEALRRQRPKLTGIGISDPTKFPAPWVQLGVSVESEEYLFARGRELKQTPAAVRFLSCEPLLDELRGLRELLLESGQPADCACGHGHGFTRCPNYGSVGERCPHAREGCTCPGFRRADGEGIHWVIAGGESGRSARPLHLSWVRQIVKVCSETRTPVFVKQLGARPVLGPDDDQHAFEPRDSHGGDPAEWPEDLRVREFPEVRHG